MLNVKILLVEDDIVISKLLYLRLLAYSNKIVVANDGEDALNKFTKDCFDIIISDISMPKMSGLEFIGKVRETNRNIPILIISGNSSQENLIKSIFCSVDGFLEKPIKDYELDSWLKKYIKTINPQEENSLKLYEDIYYYKDESKIINYGVDFTLTKKEKLLLDLFIQNVNQLVSYKKIEFFVWEKDDEIMTENSLKTLIKNLRLKTTKELFKNYSGLGYKLIIK